MSEDSSNLFRVLPYPMKRKRQISFTEFEGKPWKLIIKDGNSNSYVPHDHIYVQDEQGKQLFYLHIHNQGIDMFKCPESTGSYSARYHR